MGAPCVHPSTLPIPSSSPTIRLHASQVNRSTQSTSKSNPPLGNDDHIASTSTSNTSLIDLHRLELSTTAASGNLFLVQQLIEVVGKDPNEPHVATGLRPIHFAASRGHLDVVACLIEKAGAHVDAVDREGETALLKAAYAGHLSVVTYLVTEADANVHHQDGDGWTVLHNACSRGDLDMVAFLVRRGADVNAQSRMGHTPMINAASRGHRIVVDYLLNETDASPLIRNNFGETAYDAAAAAGEAYLCEILHAAERARWSQGRLEQDGIAYNTPYNLLTFHVTVPVILHENQRAVQSFMRGLTRPTFSSDALGKADTCGPWSLSPSGQPTTKAQVQLPPHEPNTQPWFWLTDWTIDLSHPRCGVDGWQYAKSFQENSEEGWSPFMPTAGTGWVRRRRWMRIMKRRVDQVTGQGDSRLLNSRLNPQISSDNEEDISEIDEQLQQLRLTVERLEGQPEQADQEQVSRLTQRIHQLERVRGQLEQSGPTPGHSIWRGSTMDGSNTIHGTPYQGIDGNEQGSEGSVRLSGEVAQSARSSIASYTRPLVFHWESNEQAHDCRRCSRWFNLLVRRHHCRRCGLVVCDRCSTNRVMLPFSYIVQDPSVPLEQHYLVSLHPQRVCDACFSDLSRPRSVRTPSFGSAMVRSPSAQSIMMECPVCGKHLDEYDSQSEQELHVQTCLSTNTSASMTGVRYVVHRLPPASTLIGQECVICFEEFAADDIIARLNCLCTFHRHCIHSWFSKGKECPVHSQ